MSMSLSIVLCLSCWLVATVDAQAPPPDLITATLVCQAAAPTSDRCRCGGVIGCDAINERAIIVALVFERANASLTGSISEIGLLTGLQSLSVRSQDTSSGALQL